MTAMLLESQDHLNDIDEICRPSVARMYACNSTASLQRELLHAKEMIQKLTEELTLTISP